MRAIFRWFIFTTILTGTIQSAFSQLTQWSQTDNFPAGPRSQAFTFTINDKVYVGGGWNSLTYQIDFWEFDPALNKWTQKANLPSRRYGAFAFSINGKGYMGGGDNNLSFQNDFWEYDPVSNIWTRKANHPAGARREAIGFSIGSKGYVGTGLSSGYVYLNDLWEYDPALNAWTQKANLPASPRMNASCFTIGSKGYVGFGNWGAYYNDLWEFDPVVNSWTRKASLPSDARWSAVGFSINNKGYIGAGQGFSAVAYSDFWEFDPATNSWTQKASLSTARKDAFGYVANGQAFVGGGKALNGSILSDIWLDAAVPAVKNVNDKCDNAPNASGKITNPPPGTTITITQDGNPLTYNAADSSFPYFVSGLTGTGSHTISIKFSNSIGSSQKDTVYTVTANTVPAFAFGTSLTMCTGGSVPTLSATSTNGISGTWSPAAVDNQLSGIYTFTPAAGQCASPITLSVTVTANTVPTFAFGTSLTMCAGGSVPTLPATSTNGISGTWSPATVNQLSGTYTFTPAAGQCASPITLSVTVTANTVPTFAFGTSLTLCAGGSVPTLPATSTNGVSGTWSPAAVDNRLSGTYTFTPAAGQCASTVAFTVTVTPSITPSVTINTPSTSVCQGELVSFSTTTVNRGSGSLQWKINGNNAGTGSNLTATALQNNDKVQVEMTSNLACANPATVTSNSIIMQINSVVQPAISIAGITTVTKGNASLITATIVKGGSSPVYQWQDSTAITSWTNITGGTGATLNYIPAATGVKLRCKLTTNEPCATSATVTSRPLEFTVNVPTAVGNINANDAGLHVYPNPANSYITIDTLSLSDHWETLQISDLQMKTLMSQNIQGKANITVNVSALPKGLYFAVLRKKSGETTYMKFLRM